MRVTLEREGRTATVDVASDLGSVEVGGRRYPVRVVAESALRVELEIAGERVVVNQWPEHFASPPSVVEVDGERWTVVVRARDGATGDSAGPPGPPPTPAAHPPPIAERAAAPGEIPIVPPMPGRVIEVKVRDGDRVARGDVLLVLEAMKMRNELTSPSAGIVRGLRVAAGTNVRAREPMVFVVPD